MIEHDRSRWNVDTCYIPQDECNEHPIFKQRRKGIRLVIEPPFDTFNFNHLTQLTPLRGHNTQQTQTPPKSVRT